MGTRHLICVVLDGEYKVAQYGQWDGYPTGQGDGISHFIRKDMDKDKFKAELKKLRYLSKEEEDTFYKEKDLVGYPHMSRNCGSDILSLIQDGKVEFLRNSINFANDGLFCEWGYVIDMDNEVLEVYTGFCQTPTSPEDRFHSDKFIKCSDNTIYYPIRLFAKYNFSELTSGTMDILLRKSNART